jgi:hypothetical protein
MKALPAVLFRLFWWLLFFWVMVFTAIMFAAVVPYFRFEHAADFLGTKTNRVLGLPHFQWAFYLHISSSIFVIFLGAFQFFPTIFSRFPRWHRISGRFYVGILLALAAPSGAVLAVYANAGLPAKTGFFLQSCLWWVVTAAAYRAIKKRDWALHTRMMMRSYALTLAALSLRTESYLMVYIWHTKPIETYVTVTWLSWVGNLILVETLIYFQVDKKLLRQFHPSVS